MKVPIVSAKISDRDKKNYMNLPQKGEVGKPIANGSGVKSSCTRPAVVITNFENSIVSRSNERTLFEKNPVSLRVQPFETGQIPHYFHHTKRFALYHFTR